MLARVAQLPGGHRSHAQQDRDDAPKYETPRFSRVLLLFHPLNRLASYTDA
jgi:hypothetical protein